MRAYARLVAVLSMAVFLFGAIYLGIDSNWAQIQAPEVDLESLTLPGPLYSGLKRDVESHLHRIVGKKIWDVSLSEIKSLLEKDRRVAAVQISRRWPNHIQIQVTPREPLAIFWTQGAPELIAADGSLMARVPIRDLPDVPILLGRQLRDDPKLRLEAVELIQALPEVGPLSHRQVAEIRFVGADGFELALGRGEFLIRLGRTPFDAKLARVQRVISYLDSRHLDGRVIDARFAKKVVVRLRNAP